MRRFLTILLVLIVAVAAGVVPAIPANAINNFTPAFMAGFETRQSATLSIASEGFASSGGTGFTVSSYASTGVASWGFQYDAGTSYVSPPAATYKSVSLYIRPASGAPNADCAIFGAAAGNSIYWDTDGTISVNTDATTKRITGTTAINTAAWHRICVVTSSAGSTTKLYVDGVQEGSTYGSAITFVNPALGVLTAAATTASFAVDDFVLGTGDLSNDIGNFKIRPVAPNGAGTYTNYDTTSGSATHYMNVDEAVPNPATGMDSDYNAHLASTQVMDTYALPNVSDLGISNVQAVKVHERFKSNGGTTAISTVVRTGTTNYTTGSGSGSTTWAWSDPVTYYSKPAGGAWDTSTFDGMEVGQQSTGGARDSYVSGIVVSVGYIAEPGDPASLTSGSQTSVTIDLSWTKGSQSDKTMIRYRSDGTYPTSTSDGTQGYFDTGSSTTLSGLSGDTTYKIRAWSYHTGSDLYSISTSDLTQATAAGFDISNSGSNVNFGIVSTSTTYYAKGSAPNNPVVDGDCTYSVSNDGADAFKIMIHGHNFTGGVGWTLGAPGENQARITAYYSGQNPASGVVITTSDQQFYASLGAGNHLHWDYKLETPTSVTDGVQKQTTLTLTAVSP